MPLLSGRTEGFPYSLSRWTDVSAAKWPWMRASLEVQKMIAFDPRSGAPGVWSLHPDDTMGFIFWTKNPTNLLTDRELLAPYKVKIHMTATGWEEVEKGAPVLAESVDLLRHTVQAFGSENVTWRFSPVPVVEDVVERFERILTVAAEVNLRAVFLSFLQENDLMPEPRPPAERLRLIRQMADLASDFDVRVLLCNEDRLLAGHADLPSNLGSGICAPPEDFEMPGLGRPASEGCGCVLMVDPFTINESCTMGCQYCYAADKSLSSKKRNTTRRLNMVR